VQTLTERGTKLFLYELKEQGYDAPVTQLEDTKVNNKRGYAIFKLLKSSQLRSPIYEVIEMLFLQVGPSNMKIQVNEESLEVSVKPILLHINREENSPMIDILQNNIKEGKVMIRHKEVMLDSDLETLHTVVPSKIKEKVNRIVQNVPDMTIEYFVKIAIENELKNRGIL
jgi:hypothetical protein